MIYYIYTLKHPINNEVRYVGKTINIKRRYKQHLYDKRHSHKASWVKSLKAEGLKPILTIIEECDENNWIEREMYWISQYDNLTNYLAGGGADYKRTTSEETKLKISQANLGKILSEETKLKISNTAKNRICSEEHKTKLKELYTNNAKNNQRLMLLRKSNERNCIINDICYDNVVVAIIILNISKSTIRGRIINENFPNYIWKIK